MHMLRVIDPRAGQRLCEPQQRRNIHTHGMLHTPHPLPTLLRVADPLSGPRLCEPQQRLMNPDALLSPLACCLANPAAGRRPAGRNADSAVRAPSPLYFVSSKSAGSPDAESFAIQS